MLFEYTNSKQLNNDLKFWSNSTGDLCYHGKYSVNEEELPEELQQAYYTLYNREHPEFQYLCEFKGKYYIDLCMDIDKEKLAIEKRISIDEINNRLRMKGQSLSIQPLFSKVEIVLAIDCSITGHEFNILLPVDTEPEVFDDVILYLMKNYQI